MDSVKIQFLLLMLLLAKCDSCPGRCQCCLNDICGDYLGHDHACKDGCKDGYHQPRCMWLCSEHCQSCGRIDGLCLICKPGFYAPSDECSNACEYRNCACAQTNCDYCLDGFYDVSQHCNSTCSKGCIEKKCNDNGSCDCVENFKGNNCDMCVLGKYGELCNNDCINDNCGCTNSTNCISCKAGYFDFSSFCSKSCSVGCKNICSNEGHCSCHSQFTGSNCENCKPGYYGDNCTIPCTNGCIDGTCNRNGTCDCSPNFTGARCETCFAGQYGKTCDKQCGLGCTGNICNKDNGTCICENNYKGELCDICNDGYFGSHCNSLCPDRCYNCSTTETCYACIAGFYGLDCSLNCSDKCLGSHCEKENGFCADGCVDEFTADSCIDKCDDICKTCSQTNSTHCTSCFGGFSGPSCKCIPNCQCELDSEVCNECTNNFQFESKYCKCNKKYCVEYLNCSSCLSDSFYTYNDTCCECSTNCRNGQCLSVDQCLNGCEDGYTGADCADLCTEYDGNCTKCNQAKPLCVRCQPGFSPNTDGVCTSCLGCKGNECDTESGVCKNGCRLNFWTNTCEKECNLNCLECDQMSGICNECTTNTVYGPFCNLTCSPNCIESQCNRTTGDCNNGCIPIMYGPKCEYKCPETCAISGENSKCDIEGQCIYNCKTGYQGGTCNIVDEKANKVSTAAVAGGVAGSLILATATCILIVLIRRRIKNKQRNSSQHVYINVSGTSTSGKFLYTSFAYTLN
ncbi:multiple epidermal growth factor-like domains protein 10 [Mya arenaria]|uniref:multiple epidermal growth factor-like domains protein 10 n=1 Tax=Mya arenaria TaxID=6604 RepID=UPI0022E0AEB7|nr:multiple epidermal growth factor-like domains protein 10 [Mya arenaria]